MKIYVKNSHEVQVDASLKQALEQLHIPYRVHENGGIELMEHLTTTLHSQLNLALQKAGVERLVSKKAILIEKIKIQLQEFLQSSHDRTGQKISNFLSQHFHYNYTYLACLFTSETGNSIEYYFIHRRIEMVMALLLQAKLNLTEIAHKLNFSSVAHLSSQFKKVTGYSPSQFRGFNNSPIPHPLPEC